MIQLIVIVIFSFIIIYTLINVIFKFINDNDDEKIQDKKLSRIIVSIVSSLCMGVLYIKYYTSIFLFFRYFLLMIFLIITGYIDSHSKNVYSFISNKFGMIGLIFLAINIIHFRADPGSYLIGVVGCLFLSSCLALFKLLGWGDVEVFTITSLYISGLMSVMNIFLSLAIAGIGAVIRLIWKKAKLTDTGTLCPYIALSAYLIIFFIF